MCQVLHSQSTNFPPTAAGLLGSSKWHHKEGGNATGTENAGMKK